MWNLDFNFSIKENKFIKKCDIDKFSNIMKLHNLDKNNYNDIINSENSDKLSIESDSNSYEERNKVNSVNTNNIGSITIFRSSSI